MAKELKPMQPTREPQLASLKKAEIEEKKSKVRKEKLKTKEKDMKKDGTIKNGIVKPGTYRFAKNVKHDGIAYKIGDKTPELPVDVRTKLYTKGLIDINV